MVVGEKPARPSGVGANQETCMPGGARKRTEVRCTGKGFGPPARAPTAATAPGTPEPTGGTGPGRAVNGAAPGGSGPAGPTPLMNEPGSEATHPPRAASRISAPVLFLMVSPSSPLPLVAHRRAGGRGWLVLRWGVGLLFRARWFLTVAAGAKRQARHPLPAKLPVRRYSRTPVCPDFRQIPNIPPFPRGPQRTRPAFRPGWARSPPINQAEGRPRPAWGRAAFAGFIVEEAQ